MRRENFIPTWHSAGSGASSDSSPTPASSFLSCHPEWPHRKQRYSACLWSYPHFSLTQRHSNKVSITVLGRYKHVPCEFWNLLPKLQTKTSLMAALRAFSVSMISRGLAMAALLISCEQSENKDSKVNPCATEWCLSKRQPYNCTTTFIWNYIYCKKIKKMLLSSPALRFEQPNIKMLVKLVTVS